MDTSRLVPSIPPGEMRGQRAATLTRRLNGGQKWPGPLPTAIAPSRSGPLLAAIMDYFAAAVNNSRRRRLSSVSAQRGVTAAVGAVLVD